MKSIYLYNFCYLTFSSSDHRQLQSIRSSQNQGKFLFDIKFLNNKQKQSFTTAEFSQGSIGLSYHSSSYSGVHLTITEVNHSQCYLQNLIMQNIPCVHYLNAGADITVFRGETDLEKIADIH